MEQTYPEILRSNLGSVVLQVASPPRHRTRNRARDHTPGTLTSSPPSLQLKKLGIEDLVHFTRNHM